MDKLLDSGFHQLSLGIGVGVALMFALIGILHEFRLFSSVALILVSTLRRHLEGLRDELENWRRELRLWQVLFTEQALEECSAENTPPTGKDDAPGGSQVAGHFEVIPTATRSPRISGAAGLPSPTAIQDCRESEGEPHARQMSVKRHCIERVK